MVKKNQQELHRSYPEDGKTVKEHWDGILSRFDSGLTTGYLEGINSLIQAAKARGRGT